MKGCDKCLKIRLIGGSIGQKDKITKVVNNLNEEADVEIIPARDKFKYNIKYTPAMIIDNVVVSDINKLSDDELKSVCYQFIEEN